MNFFEGPVLKCRDSRKYRACYLHEFGAEKSVNLKDERTILYHFGRVEMGKYEGIKGYNES
jgi:hypothetical protein